MKLVKEKIDLKKKNLYEKNNKLIQRSKKIFEIISFHFISNLFQDILMVQEFYQRLILTC